MDRVLFSKVALIASFVVLVYTWLVGADAISPSNDWFSYTAALVLGLALYVGSVLIEKL